LAYWVNHDERSVAVAKKKAFYFTSKGNISIKDFETYDYIYVMDNSNYDDVVQLAANPEHQKVTMILELFPGENVDVPDPYYGYKWI
jgi:protein-tyrosine phosphatase